MAKLYDRSSPAQARCADPTLLLSTIEAFLGSCRCPAVLERGENPLALIAGRYSLEISSGRLRIEVWDEERSLSRRILTAERASPGVLDCTIQLFGGQSGKLTFLDLDRPQTAHRWQRASRETFAAQFRRMLSRQFPGWEIRGLSSAKDLRRSFSSCFPRAELVRGNRVMTAAACHTPEAEPEFLSAALLWHDHLYSRLAGPGSVVSLNLFLPESAGKLTAHRLHWLTGRRLEARTFLFNQHGMAGEVNPADLGNLETQVKSHYTPVELPSDVNLLLARLLRVEGVSCCPELRGALSIRSRGLEFARVESGQVSLGIEEKRVVRPGDLERVAEFALELANLHGTSTGPGLALPSFLERWFESAIRANLPLIDPYLHLTPVHGQVLTFAGGQRELIDLLALSSAGRLSVIELKTSEDIHFPLQALDYWIRVRWHAEREEIGHLFPGLAVSKTSPKLFLVAPALSFHPANEIVLRYFSPEIEVERVGMNTDWQAGLKVLFRLTGAESPISHKTST